MRVIAYGLLTYLLIACIGGFFFYGIDFSEEDVSRGDDSMGNIQNTGNYPPAAYLTDSASRSLIPEQVQLGNIHAASGAVELANVLGTFPTVSIIFVDESIFSSDENATLLKKNFESGKVIVGLRIPHTKLSQLLGFTPTLQDLSSEEKAKSVIWTTAFYLDENGDVNEAAESWDQFPTMMTRMHALAQSRQ
jgi:hypothetical protein